MMKTVAELFAGVGGFRVGLNNVQLRNNEVIENGDWEFVFANQWEPSTKIQPAFDCYEQRFGESDSHVNEDISKIKNTIPNHNLLVGGFPCQDYSVARGLSGEKGIQGKKGVLWWEINDILKRNQPPFVLLENVDRLLKSPSTQRGRDFGIILKCFNDLGYSVEWRVINAADYGNAQKRRRVFIFAFKNTTNYYNKVANLRDWILEDGFFPSTFPLNREYVSKHPTREINLSLKKYKDLLKVSNDFKFLFNNSGVIHNGKIKTIQTEPIFQDPITLRKILDKRADSIDLALTEKSKEKFKYLKGAKKVPRVRPNGTPYFYSEGKMSFPESLSSPGRTMLTSEGSNNRSTHVIKDPKTKKLRFLSPIECERLNSFPDDWTNTGMTKRQRYFTMGNALVCNLISDMSKKLTIIFEKE